jgi:hypothetical protein
MSMKILPSMETGGFFLRLSPLLAAEKGAASIQVEEKLSLDLF